ncbi:hypothetical protein AII01_24425 [Salmonella enterica]|nr:hypothetical protein [Salmonella enterica]
MSLKFIVPENTLAMVEDGEVIRKVAEGGIEYRDPDEQICDAGSTRTVKDYLLEAVTGDHYTRMTHNADWLAFYIKQQKDTGKPVNVMTLNPNATGIHLTDVIQAGTRADMWSLSSGKRISNGAEGIKVILQGDVDETYFAYFTQFYPAHTTSGSSGAP